MERLEFFRQVAQTITNEEQLEALSLSHMREPEDLCDPVCLPLYNNGGELIGLTLRHLLVRDGEVTTRDIYYLVPFKYL